MAQTWRNDATYVRQRVALKRHYEANNLPCEECGGAFLWQYEDRKLFPDFWKHPLSFTADHIHSVNTGGRMAPGLAGLRGLHRACNSRRGDGTRNRPVTQQVSAPLKVSRRWT